MNRKQLLTLLVLVLVIGGAGLFVYKKQMAERREGNLTLGQKLLPNLPINDITRISIRQGTNEVNLVKKDDLWRVKERGDYPANFSEISGFLLKARDLKILETQQVGPSQLARLELAPGAGSNAPVVVDLRGQGDKEIQALLLGKKHMQSSKRPSPMGGPDAGWPDGRYVKVGEKSDKVNLISDPLENIEPKPTDWLNKDFLRVEKAQSVQVDFPETTNSWKLVREKENGEWKLSETKPGENPDSSKIGSVGNPLASPTFADVMVDSKLAVPGLDRPTVVKIGTFDHFAYTINVGQKTNDDYPVTITVHADLPKERTAGKDEKPEDKAKLDKEFQDAQKKLQEKLAKEQKFQTWTYLVSSWTLEPVLKPRSEFMSEKKEETDSESKTNSVEGNTAAPLPQSAVPVPDDSSNVPPASESAK